MVVGYHHFRKHPYSLFAHCLQGVFGNPQLIVGFERSRCFKQDVIIEGNRAINNAVTLQDTFILTDLNTRYLYGYIICKHALENQHETHRLLYLSNFQEFQDVSRSTF